MAWPSKQPTKRDHENAGQGALNLPAQAEGTNPPPVPLTFTMREWRAFEAAFPDALERATAGNLERIRADIARAVAAETTEAQDAVGFVGFFRLPAEQGEERRGVFEVVPGESIRARTRERDRVVSVGMELVRQAEDDDGPPGLTDTIENITDAAVVVHLGDAEYLASYAEVLPECGPTVDVRLDVFARGCVRCQDDEWANPWRAA